MILEPAYKMHQITSECIDSCEIDDNIANTIVSELLYLDSIIVLLNNVNI